MEKTEIKYTSLAAYCAVLIDCFLLFFFSPHFFTPGHPSIHSDKHKACHARRIAVTKKQEDSYVNSWLLSSKAVNKEWGREDENWKYYLLSQFSLA